MLTQFSRRCNIIITACAMGTCLFSMTTWAAGTAKPATAADIEARYQTDVARCNAGQTNQDRNTCLREAGAARNEARHRQLVDTPPSTQSQNAINRCNALPASGRQDCLTQMSGQNTVTEGSVLEGGVLRETTIPVPATPVTPGTSVTPAMPITPATPGAPAAPIR